MRHLQTGTNRWITISDKAEAPFANACKTCECVERLGIIFEEDNQKVYRCAICGAPAVHPDLTREPFLLEYRLFRDPNEPGEWPNFNFNYEPL